MSDKATPEQQKALDDLQTAWVDVAKSMSCSPVIYCDGTPPLIYEDGRKPGEYRAVWKGKPVSGENITQRVDTIIEEKTKEYLKIGIVAFADTEPLKDALLPGESRIV